MFQNGFILRRGTGMCFVINFCMIWVRNGLVLALNVSVLLISDICSLVNMDFLESILFGGRGPQRNDKLIFLRLT